MSDDQRRAERRESYAEQISTRVHAIISAAENEAASIREQAKQDAEQRVRDMDAETVHRIESARREADRLVSDRIARLSELSDALIERTEAILEHMDEAHVLRTQVDELVGAIGGAAERIATEFDVPNRFAQRSSAPRTGAERANVARPAAERASLRDELAASVDAPPEQSERAKLQAAPEAAPRARRVEDPGVTAESDAVVAPPPADVVSIPPAESREPEPAAASEPEPAKPAPEPAPDAVPERPDPRYDGARLVAAEMAAGGVPREQVEAELRDAFGIEDAAPIVAEIFDERRSPRLGGIARRVFR